MTDQNYNDQHNRLIKFEIRERYPMHLGMSAKNRLYSIHVSGPTHFGTASLFHPRSSVRATTVPIVATWVVKEFNRSFDLDDECFSIVTECCLLTNHGLSGSLGAAEFGGQKHRKANSCTKYIDMSLLPTNKQTPLNQKTH